MSAGDVYKHLSDHHIIYPNSQHKSSYISSSSASHLPPHSQDSHVISNHSNALGIHFSQNYNQHISGHVPASSKIPPQVIRGPGNHSNGQQLFQHESHRPKPESYLDNRLTAPYIEQSRNSDPRIDRETMPELKSSHDDDGGGMPLKRSMRVEEMRELYQSQSSDLKHIREQYQRLTDDNQELRDLCCFLDDDRQKGRKLAREWQRFGRYTASVMRQEVSAYQNKLRELDAKQQELIKDNLELKELCLYLDEERSNATCANCGHPLSARDDGDGSSSSTNADEHLPSQSNIQPTSHTSLHSTSNNHNGDIPLSRSSSREFLLQDNLSGQRSAFNGQVLSYIRSLEARILLLETEKQQLAEDLLKTKRSHPEGEGLEIMQRENGLRPPHPPPYSLAHQMRAMGLGISANGHLNSGDCDDEPLGLPPPPPVTRPAAVAAAMRVLEVQEQLESLPPPPSNLLPSEGLYNQASVITQTNPTITGSNYQNQQYLQQQDLADGEKAILRQMCNVVWRKLEEVPNQNR